MPKSNFEHSSIKLYMYSNLAAITLNNPASSVKEQILPQPVPWSNRSGKHCSHSANLLYMVLICGEMIARWLTSMKTPMPGLVISGQRDETLLFFPASPTYTHQPFWTTRVLVDGGDVKRVWSAVSTQASTLQMSDVTLWSAANTSVSSHKSLKIPVANVLRG